MPQLLIAAFLEGAGPRAKAVIYYDSEIPGYGLKVTPAGKRVLLLQYWSPVIKGLRRRLVIGELGEPISMPDGSPAVLTAFTGRKIAHVIRGVVNSGRDPFLERAESSRREESALRTERLRQSAAQSVAAIAEDFLTDARQRELQPRTVTEWERLIAKHVLPVIGHRPIGEIGKEDALLVKRSIPKGRNVLANRVQQVCRALVNFAGDERDGLANPFVTGRRGSQRWYAEHLTRRPLSREELARLFAALDAVDSSERGGSVDAIRLLALTGWRKSEVLSLKWSEVDFETGQAMLGRTKTGRSERALSPESLALLSSIPRKGTYVFPSPHGTREPRRDVKRTWLEVRAAAGIDAPLHALRHTAATIALSEGVPLAVVGALLGHKDPKTTQRYARTEQKAASAAAAVLGAAIARSTGPAAVTPISRGRRRRA